jgi:ferredoxin
VELRQRASNDLRFKVPWARAEEALASIKVEVELGFDAATAFKEAQRCLNCDVQTVFTDKPCIECDACVDICPMDCISFTDNGDEAELRTRLKAPALNTEQDLYVSAARSRPAGDGQGRGRLPALRPVRRALPHRGLGHAEVPAAHPKAGPAAPDSVRSLETQGGGRMKRIEAVNDFVIKFANVNGSGSASGQRAVRQGGPAHGRAGEPAQHLPQQHPGPAHLVRGARVRAGWLGRRGGIDMMVAMNPQTWDADLAELEPGGYLFYDSTRPLPTEKFRDDIHVIGMPLTAICNATYTDPRQRQLFKNIVYVGALSQLLDIEPR